MGCPPDPVEVSIWHSGERIGLLQEKYGRLRAEYLEAVELALHFNADIKIEAGYPPAEKFIRRTSVNPTEAEPYADDADQHRLERENEAKVKELENRLCTVRTSLLKSAKTAPEFARQRELHLAHRLEDRTLWTQWLTEKIELLQFLLNDKEDHGINKPAPTRGGGKPRTCPLIDGLS